MFVLKELNDDIDLENQIFDIFVKQFKKCIKHKTHLTFDELIIQTFANIGINYNGESLTFLKSWFDQIYNMNFLEGLIDNQTEELILHSPTNIQIKKRDKSKTLCVKHLNIENDYNLILETLSQKHSIEWTTRSPFVSFKGKICLHQFRISLIHNSTLSTKYHKVFLRRINQTTFSPSDFYPDKSFLEKLILKKKNILISGATGSGKTSFIKSLFTFIPLDEHTILLEDTEELSNGETQFTCMLAKHSANYSLEKYCEYSMRMRPDRIILGEMRSTEVIPFLLSMNNGHQGSMSTIHANSAVNAIQRAALLFEFYNESKSITYEQILKLICQNLDYVIHLDNKKVVEIIKIIGYSNDQIRYEDLLFK